MQLYDFAKSGNCYKIRLFLSILGIRFTRIPVDMMAGECQTEQFLKINPNGMIPVLIDGELVLYESAAILVYLARHYADKTWFPDDPLQSAQIVRWLAFEQNEGRYGLARARVMALKLHSPLRKIGTLEESQQIGHLALQILERQLAATTWLAATIRPTIADLACYPYVLLAPEGGIPLEKYPAIQRWLNDIKQIPGYCELLD